MLLSLSCQPGRGPRVPHRSHEVQVGPPEKVETYRPVEDGRDPYVRTQKMGVVMAGLLMLARDSRSIPTAEPGSCLYVCVSL